MVVSRSDNKRRRKEVDILDASLIELPKRTKVMAQRKFAQGSSTLSSTSAPITPIKEKEKEKEKINTKANSTIPSVEMLPLPSKRPKTEDFLTFLCFRGTSVCPDRLESFGKASVHEATEDDSNTPNTSITNTSTVQETVNSKINSSDTLVGKSGNSTSSHRPRHTNSSETGLNTHLKKEIDKKKPVIVQALQKKYQEQRLAKNKSITTLARRVKGKNMMITRSSIYINEKETKRNQTPLSKKNEPNKSVRNLRHSPIKSVIKNPSRVSRNHQQKSVSKANRRSHSCSKNTILKSPQDRRVGLRSSGVPSALNNTQEKSRRRVSQIPQATTKIAKDKKASSNKNTSDFSSDDDEPLAFKTRSKTEKINIKTKVKKNTKNITTTPITRKSKIPIITSTSKSTPTKHLSRIPRRQINILKETSANQSHSRPSRKSKEAATVYMELLGKRLIGPEDGGEEDEYSTASMESFLDLPLSRRTSERKEVDNSAQGSKQDKQNEKSKTISKLKDNKPQKAIVKNPKDQKETIKENKDKKNNKILTKERYSDNKELKNKSEKISKSTEKNKVPEIKPGNKSVSKKETKQTVVTNKIKINKTKPKETSKKESSKKQIDIIEEKLENTNLRKRRTHSDRINYAEPDESDYVLSSEEELDMIKLSEKDIPPQEPKSLKKIKDNKSLVIPKTPLTDFNDSDEEPLGLFIQRNNLNKKKSQNSVSEKSEEKNNLETIFHSSSPAMKISEAPSSYSDELVIDEGPKIEKEPPKEEEIPKERSIDPITDTHKIAQSLSSAINVINSRENIRPKKCAPSLNKFSQEILMAPEPTLPISDPERTITKCHLIENDLKEVIPTKAALERRLSLDLGYSKSQQKVNLSNERIHKWLKESIIETNKKEETNIGFSEISKINSEIISGKNIVGCPVILEDINEHTVKIEKCISSKANDSKSIDKPYPNQTLHNEDERKKTKINSERTLKTPEKTDKKSIFGQRRKRMELIPSASAFSPENESSVYAFEADPEQPPNTPFRRRAARDSRTSSTATSRSEEDESSPGVTSNVQPIQYSSLLPPPPPPPSFSEIKTVKTSTSIAVQVNLDNENSTEAPASPVGPVESSTQTPEDDDDDEGHLFYIPLQESAGNSTAIQGVAVKLGTEGPNGPNQRVIMKAKLVTKLPNFNRTVSCASTSTCTNASSSNIPDRRSLPALPTPILGSRGEAHLLQKSGSPYPPVGTVQPTTRSGTAPAIFATPSTPSVYVSPTTQTNSTSSSVPPVVASVMPSVSNDNSSHIAGPSKSATGKRTSKNSKQHKENLANSGNSNENICLTAVNAATFPDVAAGQPAQMVQAPTFRPTEKEFQDPLEYIDKIRPLAEKFGICRIVPPSNFKPECKVTDEMRFTAYNQYVHKMLHRWGPNVREMMAIRKYLATQSISLNQLPWIGGMEVDLPRLYQTVQTFGGLKEVIEKKRWQRVADRMRFPKNAQERLTKLDDIYCKYLLPYDTLSHEERQKLFSDVEREWVARESRIPSRDSASGNETATEDGESTETDPLEEADECIVKGRNIALNAFYRIARNTMAMLFRTTEPHSFEVEQEYWQHVQTRLRHVCVHSGSIDSSGWGYGFACTKNSPFARHPWNLKVLTNNNGSVLRSLGPVMGVTVPTLHVGMVFTTCCWYRDPHGLPWIEYLHSGASKIWYGIPDQSSEVFRSAVERLMPRYCLNKTIWLPSDTAMIPPPLLVKNGVPLCQTVQEPGQFILVFPKAFTSSICTGYLVSESVYFAQSSWLTTAEQVFKDIQNSCEPPMFSLERLLFCIAQDTRSSVEVLKQVLPMVKRIRDQENDKRSNLISIGINTERLPLPENISAKKKRKNKPLQEENGEFECEICRTNIFISMVSNSEEDTQYCLSHGFEILTRKRHLIKNFKLMFTYDEEDINEIISKIEDKIESKSNKKK